MITFEAVYRAEGQEPSRVTEFFDTAWSEFIELQVMDQQAWVAQSLAEMRGADRLELLALDDSRPVGGLILTWGSDVHVGPCVAVTFNYVLPEYRTKRLGSVLFREVLRLTKRLGYPMLSYTHRVRDWEYSTKYRRIHGAEEAKQDAAARSVEGAGGCEPSTA